MANKNIYVGDLKIGEEEKRLVNNILETGRISEYKYVNKFEKRFADIIGTEYCTLVNSGTSALVAGLLALINDNRFPKFKKGAKVITTPLTYIATSNAIKLVGLEPVFVDVTLDTFSIKAEEIERILKIDNTSEYCAILPVHLMGYPCEMDEINRIANEHDLIVFEDAAQAHGSKYKGENVGKLSLLADYSFYIAHNIQVGEMGAVVTDDERINKYVKKIKANGRVCDCSICTRSKGHCIKQDQVKGDPRFLHDMLGFNFKTMEFQAAIGLAQLDKFNSIIDDRQENVKLLNLLLQQHEDLFYLPKFSEEVSYLAYPLVLKEDCLINREELRNKLSENNIESRPLFGSIPTQQPAYKEYKELYKDKLPNADYLGDNAFYIGCHQYLNEEDIKYIAEVFDKVLEELV